MHLNSLRKSNFQSWNGSMMSFLAVKIYRFQSKFCFELFESTTNVTIVAIFVFEFFLIGSQLDEDSSVPLPSTSSLQAIIRRQTYLIESSQDLHGYESKADPFERRGENDKYNRGQG